MKLIDLTGKRFGRLTVIKRNNNNKKEYPRWDCICDCGNKVNVLGYDLRNGSTKSCGCYAKERRIESKSKSNVYNLENEYGIGYISNTNNEFYFDLDDYEKIKDYCWNENDQGYAIAHQHGTSKNIRMHQPVTDFKFKIVDHINNNRLDNRKLNLRSATKQTNGINRGTNKNNKLGVKGVFQLKNGHYMAKIQKDNKTYTKSDKDINVVIEWRRCKELELYGEFAYKYDEEK